MLRGKNQLRFLQVGRNDSGNHAMVEMTERFHASPLMTKSIFSKTWSFLGENLRTSLYCLVAISQVVFPEPYLANQGLVGRLRMTRSRPQCHVLVRQVPH